MDQPHSFCAEEFPRTSSDRLKRCLLGLVLSIAAVASAAAQCAFGPLPGLHRPGPDRIVSAMCFADLGRGTRLIFGGRFEYVGGQSTERLVSFDGRWFESIPIPYPDGYQGRINALTTYDSDGDGPAPNLLVVGGGFDEGDSDFTTNGIVAWDGSAWFPLGGGISPGRVHSIEHFDPDGPGPAGEQLIVAGYFERIGEIESRNIAAWDGQAWRGLGGGLAQVNSIAVFTPAAGHPGIYASDERVIREWDGSAWRAFAGTPHRLNSLKAIEPLDGRGPELYAVGSMSVMAGISVHEIAAWDGKIWRDAGDPRFSSAQRVQVSYTADGPKLYVAAGRILAHQENGIWVDDGPISSLVNVLASTPAVADSEFSGLFIGGGIDGGGTAEINPATNGVGLVRYDGTTYHGLGGGQGATFSTYSYQDAGDGLTNTTSALPFAFRPQGSPQPRLFAAALDANFGGARVTGLLSWTGSRWNPIPNTAMGMVFAAQLFDDGRGPAMCLAGNFDHAGDLAAANIVRWDGTAFSSLGAGLNGAVYALTVYDEGNGPLLYAGGDFTDADNDPNTQESWVARWTGSRWEGLAGGQLSGPLPYVRSLTVYDPTPAHGQPGRLIVGGFFSQAGPTVASKIAAWDGANWSAVGSGLPFAPNSLASFDDGSGLSLYATVDALVSFNTAIWRWNGSTWAAGLLGQGRALCVVDEDGDGPAPARLFAGGESGPRLVEWTGSMWEERQISLPDPTPAPRSVYRLAALQTSTRGELWAMTGYGVAALVPLGPEGDIDRNGATELADLVLLLSHFGEAAATFFDGDLNADDNVDLQDLAIVLANLGTACGD